MQISVFRSCFQMFLISTAVNHGLHGNDLQNQQLEYHQLGMDSLIYNHLSARFQ